MINTRQWIDDLERWAFPSAFNEPVLPKDHVYSFISKTTVMNELMHNVSDDYVRELVNSMYTIPRINRHQLKRYVILDYPLAVIESIFRKEHVHKIRSIQAGLYPYNSGREINACAIVSPAGDGVVFFSEWLYAFLWDYFHAVSDTFLPGTRAGNSTAEHQREARKIKTEFIRKLKTGAYKNWDMNAVIASNRVTNSAKYDLLFALIFIWAHELGHIFLSHHDASQLGQKVFISEDGEECQLPVYNLNQVQEFDADMFASDIYFAYLTKGISFQDESFKLSAIARGLEFLELLAYTEKEPSSEDWKNASHPPSPSRLLNICLRHRDLLSKYGWGDLFVRLKHAAGKGNPISKYDFQKDVGANLLLQ